MVINYLLSRRRFKLIYSNSKIENPICTIVVPVFNQEMVIFDHLNSIVDNLFYANEVLIIDDSSIDNTLKEIERFLAFTESRNLKHNFKLFQTKIPMFESQCEDFGYRKALGGYLIGIQADMKIFQKDFDKYLVDTIEETPNLMLISCRGTHPISELINTNTFRGRELSDAFNFKYFFKKFFEPKLYILSLIKYFRHIIFSQPTTDRVPIIESTSREAVPFAQIFPSGSYDRAGWLGNLIESLPYNYDERFDEIMGERLGTVWFGETVMRGPIFIRKTDYETIGGLNTKAFYQGLDDHDLCVRINEFGFRVGFLPLRFAAPLNLNVAGKKKNFSHKVVSHLHAKLRRKNFKNSALMKKISGLLEPPAGIEPATLALRERRSTD